MTLAASSGDDSQRTKFTGTGTTATGNLPMGWQKVTVPAVSVRQGDLLTISLTASGASWWSADNFQLTLVQADPTAIEDVRRTTSAPSLYGEEIYNLAGQRLSKMQKGINIQNGKKYLIK